MARFRTFYPVWAVVLAALLGALLCPLASQADDSGSAATASAAAAQAATPPPAQKEGAAPQMSGAAATLPQATTGTETVKPQAAEPPLTPMQAEIRQAIEGEQAKVAELAARLSQAKDSAAAAEIQKQVQDTKIQTQLTILQIQVRYARAEGREDVAVQIETAIREMTAPKAPGKPIDRPPPTQAPAAGAQQH